MPVLSDRAFARLLCASKRGYQTIEEGKHTLSMNMFKSLKHRAFAFLWSGQTVSRLGDNFYAVALALWVLEKTGSAAAMGLVLICTTVTQVALSLPGGVLVDRFSRLSLMLASDLLLSYAAAGSMLAALWTGWQKRLRRRAYLVYGPWLAASLMLFAMGLPLPFAVMCLAICIWGAGIALLGLAWTNSLQELVPPDRLGRVASIDALGSYVLLPVGYGLAGIAADHFGAALVFVVGGLLSAAMIASGLLHPAVRAVD